MYNSLIMAIKDARSYNRLIEIWRKESTTNEYGSNIETDVLVKSIWAKIQTNAGTKFVNFGIQDFKNTVIFSVRGIKNDIDYNENYFIKYKGVHYFIKGMQDVGLESIERIIYADSE